MNTDKNHKTMRSNSSRVFLKFKIKPTLNFVMRTVFIRV